MCVSVPVSIPPWDAACTSCIGGRSQVVSWPLTDDHQDGGWVLLLIVKNIRYNQGDEQILAKKRLASLQVQCRWSRSITVTQVWCLQFQKILVNMRSAGLSPSLYSVILVSFLIGRPTSKESVSSCISFCNSKKCNLFWDSAKGPRVRSGRLC